MKFEKIQSMCICKDRAWNEKNNKQTKTSFALHINGVKLHYYNWLIQFNNLKCILSRRHIWTVLVMCLTNCYKRGEENSTYAQVYKTRLPMFCNYVLNNDFPLTSLILKSLKCIFSLIVISFLNSKPVMVLTTQCKNMHMY